MRHGTAIYCMARLHGMGRWDDTRFDNAQVRRTRIKLRARAGFNWPDRATRKIQSQASNTFNTKAEIVPTRRAAQNSTVGALQIHVPSCTRIPTWTRVVDRYARVRKAPHTKKKHNPFR